MDAISRPVQILLAVVLAFAALWFVALRPKSDAGSSSAPSAPGAQGLGRAVSGAKGAVAKSNTPSSAAEQTTGGTASSPTAANPSSSSSSSATKPATTKSAVQPTRDRSKPILAELAKGKVVVLLFWNPRASDDRSVHAVLRAVNRHSGKVAVHSARISQVGDYLAITSGVQVLGSPTALVIDKKRQAKQITGFNDATAIDQSVNDALAGRLEP
jgi:hypothetical protein